MHKNWFVCRVPDLFSPLYKPATKSMNCSSDLMIFTPTLSPPFFPDVKACVWLEIFHPIPHIYFFYICEMLRFAWLDNYHTLFYYFSLSSLCFSPRWNILIVSGEFSTRFVKARKWDDGAWKIFRRNLIRLTVNIPGLTVDAEKVASTLGTG